MTFPRLLDIVADAAIYALTHDAEPRFPEVREKSETSEHNPIFGNKTAGRGRVRPRSGPQISVLPRTSGQTQIKGVNAPDVDRYIELPIGN